MEKVWYSPEFEIAFESQETAINSAESYLKENIECKNITIEKISDDQYCISGVRSKGIHFIERIYVFEIPVYENAEKFKEDLKGIDLL